MSFAAQSTWRTTAWAVALAGFGVGACQGQALDLGDGAGQELIVNTTTPPGLEADSSHVYWGFESTRGVFACEAERCKDSVAELDAPWSTSAFGGGRVVFTMEHSLRSCAASGCAADSLDLLQTQAFGILAIGVDADRDKVYFHASDGTTYECPERGCVPEPRGILSQPGTEKLIARNGILYSLSSDGSSNRLSSLRQTSDRIEVTTIIEGHSVLAPGFAVGDAAVYWIQYQLRAKPVREIVRCAIPDCASGPARVAVPGAGCETQKLAVDDANGFLYWLDRCLTPEGSRLGQVRRCPLSGCNGEPEVVTPGPARFVDFALTPGSLWLSQAASAGQPPAILRWRQ